MKDEALKIFALNVVEAIKVTPANADASPTTPRQIFRMYNALVGPDASLTFARFGQYVLDAKDEGLLVLRSAGVFDPSNKDHKTRIDQADAIPRTYTRARRGRQITETDYWLVIEAKKAKVYDLLRKELKNELLADVNQDVFDTFIRHQINLLRTSEGMKDRIIKLLNETEKDLAEQLRKRLRGLSYSSLGGRRLKLLEAYVKELRKGQWGTIRREWIEEMRKLAEGEPRFVKGLLEEQIPVVVSFALPSTGQLRGIVSTDPFQGRILKDWAKKIEDQDIDRILTQIQIGLVNGENSDQIARRIVGSARLKGTDGVTEITRRDAASISRTAVMAISHAARAQFYDANSNLFEKERYVATLDSRTTPVCRANDGRVYKVGKGPRPPLHWNCRSIRIPYFLDGVFGDRPARNFTEQQLVRDYSRSQGLKVQGQRGNLPRGHKGKFDAYAREQKRRLTSIVPAERTFDDFLSSQRRDVQDDILGPTRAKLFRKGGLRMDKFVNDSGKTYTLSQLSELYRKQFIRAGLDPDAF